MTEFIPLKLKPEVKADWLIRLRSRNYAQGKGKLNDGQGNFCCLGVLCETAVDDEAIMDGIPKQYGIGDSATTVVYGSRDGGLGDRYYPGSGNYLPELVAEWAYDIPEGYKLSNLRNWDNPHVPNPNDEGFTVDLATLNDDYGYTFEQIADLVEEHL